MAGIYIHIPFCASRCIYCDFYSTTCAGEAERYVNALAQEMTERQGFFAAADVVRTVYIGGGTPSLLPPATLSRIFDRLAAAFDLRHVIEVTLEANPEDITADYARALTDFTPVNRVSMGVQSFIDTELRTLGRRHNAARPAEAVDHLRHAGIGNIGIDLMYGLPGQTSATWYESIRHALALAVEHISTYCLSVESGTRLERAVRTGTMTVADEEACIAFADTLRQQLSAAKFEHYEISNYARPGFRALHNANYWNGTPYIGLGPGAHSYDGHTRRTWNAPDLRSYLLGRREETSETLTDTDRYNETVMLALRTLDGLSLARLHEQFRSSPHLLPHFFQQLQPLLRRGWLTRRPDQTVALTAEGLPMADAAIRTLFYV